LGYSVGYCKILNEGGTAFSDALLNIKKAVSKTPLNENLYKKSGEAGDFTVYDCKYTLPFGLITDKAFADTNTYLSGIALQNDIYQKLTGSDGEITEDCAKYYEKCETADGNEFYTFRLDIKGEKTLYANSLIHDSAQKYIFFVNGSPAVLPYFDNKENYTFPNFYNNGFAELGTYKDEEVELTVQTQGPGFGHIEIGLLDNKKLSELEKTFETSRADNVKADKNKLTMTAFADKPSLLFLPAEYSKNWHAKVNGTDKAIIPVMDRAFMAVELVSGQNEIELVHKDGNILKCTVITVLGIIGLIALALLKRGGRDITRNAFMKNAAFICFNIASAAALAAIYIIPLAAGVLFGILRLLGKR
ncbi:MAG: YfhO family protein, partial [Firmicutes bacterium]|nr:YfhO family protein [Bacillota bacterium]